MSSRLRWLLGMIGMLVVLWLFWTIMQSLWLHPVGKLKEQAAKLDTRINQYRDALVNVGTVNESIDSYVERTLGGSRQYLDHRLRSRLNRLGETVGLAGMSVGTGRSVPLLSPGRSDFTGSSKRALREEVDFVEVEGRLSGTTSWAGVLELLDRLDAEPWIKKIEQVRLRAEGDGSRVHVSIRLKTLFVPGNKPDTIPESEWAAERLASMQVLAARSPFIIPVAPPPAAVVTATPTTQKSPPRWQVTGVAGIGDMGEVWIRNTNSGRTRRLTVGDRQGELVLEAIEGDIAAFRSGDSVVSIQVGQLLSDTPPVHK